MRSIPRSTVIPRQIGWLNALVLTLACSTSSLLAQGPDPEPLPETVQFNRDIRPILSDKCYRCHGPDSGTRRAGLRLDDAEAVLKDAVRGAPADGVLRVIAPGDPDRSAVMHRITASDPGRRMPYGEAPLAPREVALIARWIEQGAQYEPHWAFIAPARPAPPAVRSAAWPRNPIDAFILARLEREGLQPSPAADRRTLLRRVTLDLTGLPPTPAEVAAFVADESPDAYENAVERLLASPRYGERMAAAWLAAARYADSSGYFADQRRDMSRWRDWVIDAFNRNLTFDRFTIEQLAGDLLPNATLDQKIATGFNRNHRMNSEMGIIAEEFFVESVVDRVSTTGTVWLGLTVGCARCHDHKFDPITQEEFYRLFAYFNSIAESGIGQKTGNTPPLVHAPTPEQQAELDAIEERIAAAEAQLAEFRPQIDEAQRLWEQSIGDAEPVVGVQEDGLTAHFPLSSPRERHFDGRRFVDGGSAGRRGPKTLDAYLQDPDPNAFDGVYGGGQALTLAAWIEPEAATGPIITRTLLDTPRGQGFSLLLADGRLQLNLVGGNTGLWMDNDSGHVKTVAALTPGSRRHVAATYDGSRQIEGVALYVDGERQALKVLFNGLGPQDPTEHPLRVGAGGGPERFRGSIWDVRVYDRALAPEQVAALAEPASLAEIAAVPPARRTPAQAHKIDSYFLAHQADARIDAARIEARRRERPSVSPPRYPKPDVTVGTVLAELGALRQQKAEFLNTVPTVMVMQELPQPRDAHLLLRGNYDRPGRKVERGTPAWLPPPPAGAPDNRLGLAMWLVDPSHPLTARVAVNRFWEMNFGTGLVKSTDNFGAQGDLPSHPALLDWLATEFVRSGWDMKAMHRLIVTSATYRQSSAVTPALQEADPDNRLLARGPRYRLPAEMLRDQLLAVSGLLVDTIGGPSVKPYQPAGLWAGSLARYEQGHGEDLYRRSLYTYVRRTVPPPSMSLFDVADRDNPSVSTNPTNTPLQALNLMNDVAALEAARVLAERMLTDGGATRAERLAFAFRLATAREPSEPELGVLLNSLENFDERYRRDREAATSLVSHGEHPRDESLDVAELAAHAAVASLILNLDEVLTKH